jgi:hypothetical protein
MAATLDTNIQKYIPPYLCEGERAPARSTTDIECTFQSFGWLGAGGVFQLRMSSYQGTWYVTNHVHSPGRMAMVRRSVGILMLPAS